MGIRFRSGTRVMKNQITLVALLAATGLGSGGCSDDPASPEEGGVVELAAGASTWLATVNVQVRFLGVEEDSRCPTQAQCVWAGDGAVRLELTPASGDPSAVTLHTNTDSGTDRVELPDHVLRLLRLDPYPEGSPIESGDYRLSLKLERRF